MIYLCMAGGKEEMGGHLKGNGGKKVSYGCGRGKKNFVFCFLEEERSGPCVELGQISP